MKVTNIDFAQAEAIQQLKPDEVLISIGEQYGDFWKLQVDGERVLKLRFADVRGVTTHQGIVYNPMNVEQAHEILKFVGKWRGYDILVNCAMGVSRSGAVALALHFLYGYELKPYYHFTSEPNPFCVGLLLCEYHKIQNGVYGN